MRINHYSLILAALVTLACDRLPEFPNAAIDRVPASLEFNGLTLAVGFEGAGGAVDPADILAGTAVEAAFTVRAQDGFPLEGALIQFGVKTEQWARILDFPLGTSCTTDEEGQCSTILRSERRAGPGQFEARVGRLPPQSIDILVNPDEAQAKVTVEIEGLGNYNWETGQRVDPLNNESTRLVLNKDQAQGTTFRVRLLDAFDNPLVGLPVTLTVLAEENQAISDAGPADAAATDSHALDAHTNLDATPNLDSGTDVGTDTGTDAGTNANTDTGTPTDLATPADAGNNKVLSLTPNSDSAMVALATAEGCPLSLPGGAQISADVQDDGYVRFCILPGQETTSFTLRIQPADLFRVGDASSMQLNGETRAGAPSAVVYVPSHEVENGQEIRLGCLPGGLSAVASFRVQNEQGSVPNVRVKFDAAGGLTGLTSALEVSDEQGLVQVQAICPANSLAGGRILADLAEVSDDVAASVAVQVRTDGIDQITIVEHGAWPPTLRSGVDILTLRFQAFNEANAPVLRAGLRPEDNAPDNRDPLAFTVTIASQGHARRVLLDAGNGEYTRPLVEHTILVDQDSGAADFSFKLQSPATYEHPLVLRVFEPGSQVSKTRSLHVTPGTPSQITVSPSGTVNAELMAGAGSFAFSVWDGDPAQGANRVPDVPISVAVPRSFVFLRGSSLALISGRTGNDGRFVVDVLQAQPMGEHELEGAIIVDDRTLAVGLTINVGAGEVVSALEMSLDGQVLPIITPEGGEALPTLTMRGGTRLDQTLRFRVVNRFGGGMPALGLAWTLQQGQQANCATFDEPGQTDERGEITFGPGALTVTAGGAVTDCVYRFAHGNTAAVQRLRVRQVPGLPNRATLSVTLRDAENDASAVRLRNSMDPPDEWSDETSRELILQAWDANNLAPAGLRMWLEVDNCFVEQRSAELDDLGRATFRVAGGVDAQTPCVLSARYFNERDEYTAPTLQLTGSGFVAPQLSAVGFAGSGDSFHLISPFTTEYTWTLTGTGIRGPAGWLNGLCPQPGQCTYGQIVEMSETWNNEGERSVLRVLTDNIPLTTVIQNGERRYSLRVVQSMMGPGRWLGIRIKDPGGDQQNENQNLASVSRVIPFAAIPPVNWVSVGPGALPSQVSVEGDGIVIHGGHRINLDGDSADEFMLCGEATGGRNIFAVVDRAPDGTLPAQVPAVLSVEGSRDPQIHPQNACRLADLDSDGRLDLVLPGPNRLPGAQAGFLGFTVHRGVEEGFFDTQGQQLVWQIPALVNQNSVHFVLKTGPASIVACVATNCAQPKELFINWNAQTQQFSAGAMADHNALSGAHQNPQDNVVVGSYHVEQGATLTYWAYGARSLGKLSANRMIEKASYDRQKLILADDSRRRLYIYRASDGVVLRTLKWDGLPEGVGFQRLVFNEQGTRVAATVGSEAGNLLIWNIEQGGLGATLDPERAIIYAGLGLGVSVAFSPDGEKVSAGGRGNTVRIWNVGSGEMIVDLPGVLNMVSWHPDSTKVVAIRKWDYQKYIAGYDLSFNPVREIFRHSIRENNRYLVSGLYRIRTLARWKIIYDSAHVDEVDWIEGFSAQSPPFAKHVSWDSSDNGGLQVFSGGSGTSLGRIAIYRNELLGRIDQYTNSHVTGLALSADNRGLYFSANGATYHYDISAFFDGRFLPSVAMGNVRDGGDKLLAGHESVSEDIAFYNGSNFYLKRPITWAPGCGNDVVEPGEGFDTGQPDEVSEYAYTCGAVCGDGVLQSGEGCDDGNRDDADGCSSACNPHSCGDGIVRQDLQVGDDGYESCDDVNAQWDDGCGPDCNRCGDGVVGSFESCDDGNDVVDDGCSNCTLATCGNGVVDQGEECDDQNNNETDGCTTRCRSNCAYIDFTNQAYASIPLAQPPASRTVEVWLRNLNEASRHVIMTHWMVLDVNRQRVHARAFTNNCNCVRGASRLFDVAIPETINLDQPIHVAVTYNGHNAPMALFINGESIGVTNRSDSSSGYINSRIAIYSEGDRVHEYYLTSFRALRFSNGIRYSENFSPTTQLIADPQTAYLYRTDGLTQNQITDIGPNSVHAILTGTPGIVYGDCR